MTCSIPFRMCWLGSFLLRSCDEARLELACICGATVARISNNARQEATERSGLQLIWLARLRGSPGKYPRRRRNRCLSRLCYYQQAFSWMLRIQQRARFAYLAARLATRGVASPLDG